MLSKTLIKPDSVFNSGDKMKNKSIVIFVLAILIVFSYSTKVAALDHVVISQVLYNPNGSDTDREAVELFNPTNNSINITGWTLRTESKDIDATIPNAVIKPNSYFLISDSGWETHKNLDWPSSDYEESISLSNTNAGVALIDLNNQTVDAVGWGDSANIKPGLFEGNPAVVVSDGQSLIRTKINGSFIDTNNNSNDFYAGSPELHNSNYSTSSSNKLEVEFNVVEPDLKILNMTLTDDLNETNESITPSPGGNRMLSIKVETNLNSSVTLFFNNQSYAAHILSSNNSSYLFSADIPVPYYLSPGIHSIHVEAEKGNKTDEDNITFNYESLISLFVDSTNINLGDVKAGSEEILFGDKDVNSSSNPTVKNIGNVKLNINVKKGDSTNFNFSNVYFSFGNSMPNISISNSHTFNIGLSPSESESFNIKLDVPSTNTLGSCSFSVVLEGVENE